MPATPNPPHGPPRVFDIDLDAFGEERVPELFAWLDEAERQRASRMATALLQRRFVAAHAATRMLLAEQLGVEPDDLGFQAGTYGKPVLARPRARGLHFNLSHCRGRALLAISTSEVGIDLEAWIPSDWASLAREILTPREHERFNPLPAQLKPAELCRYWAAKEALLKACGLGLQLAPDSVAVDLDGGWHRLPAPAAPVAWWLQPVPIHGQFCGYLASREAGELEYLRR